MIAEQTFRSMRQVCERFFPQRHANRDCDCPMPPDPFRALMEGAITAKAYVKSLDQRKPAPLGRSVNSVSQPVSAPKE